MSYGPLIATFLIMWPRVIDVQLPRPADLLVARIGRAGRYASRPTTCGTFPVSLDLVEIQGAADLTLARPAAPPVLCHADHRTAHTPGSDVEG